MKWTVSPLLFEQVGGDTTSYTVGVCVNCAAASLEKAKLNTKLIAGKALHRTASLVGIK